LDTLRSEYQRNSMKQAETIRETQGSGVRILVTPGGNDSFPANSYYLANLEYVYDDYGASGSSAISVWSTKSNNSGLSSADINRDNRVDLRDFSIMNAEFMKNLSQYQADLNHDGRVDIIDFSILNNQFSLL